MAEVSYAVVSYIPALHRGYLDFFKKYPGTLYVLGADFISAAPRLERDIRALTPEEVKALLESAKLVTSVIVLTKETLPMLLKNMDPLIMPDDEVNRAFATANLPGKSVEFIPVFLRWNRQISTTEFEVPPDRVTSQDAFDAEIMANAKKEAVKSPDWWRQVGAILIRDKKAVLSRHNEPIPANNTPNIFGDPRANFDAGEVQYKELGKFIHAEAGIIAEAAKRGIATDGASLYVTTFPCPACAKSIAVAGVATVYYQKGYSLLDAEDILRDKGVQIVMVQ
jgi:dCMP deaminase